MSRGSRRDRLVYLRSHPLLFALLSATRFTPTLRIGRTVLVHGTDGYLDGLTRVRLDRTAPGSTGGIARATGARDLLFDEDGAAHRTTRRSVSRAMGINHLAPLWQEVLRRRLQPLGNDGTVDAVAVAVELTGVTTAALLNVGADAVHLALTARRAAADAARRHLTRRTPNPDATATDPAATDPAATDAARELIELTGSDRGAMLAVATVNTMVAALPRAVAWCADDDLWGAAADDARRPALVDELFRVIAPSPILPRVAAENGNVAGRPVRQGDRLILVARHAADAHRRGPDPDDPAPAKQAQLVFGAGPHACPGARLAKAQLADALEAFAKHRPVVVKAKVDRTSALPGWSTLEVRAG